MESLYNEFFSIFNNRENWFRFDNRKNAEILDFSFNELFKDNSSNNFIRSMYFHEGLASLINKIKFPRNRDYHSVSAFLFGILLKNKLTLSMKKLPRVCNDYNKSFLYFWSMVCLSHDITYYIENNSSNYITDCKTIDEFISAFHLEYNLLKETAYASTFKKYYSYRVNNHVLIDHGIASGLIIYDLLMRKYHESVALKKVNPDCIISTSDSWKYSKDFPKYALKIAETIARHNLWVADDKRISTYEKYDLFELIPNKSYEKVSYSEEDSLLFLLGLVDTLDPIKCFSTTENDCYRILKDINVKFNSKNKEIYIESPQYLHRDILDKWKELSNWMSLDIEIDDIKHSIIIRFKYETTKEAKIVA